MTAMNLEPFKDLIKENCGLCFQAEKEALLADNIRARMFGRGLSRESDYLASLQRDDNELHHLINLLTINETYFYREPVHLEILADRLFPAMLASGTPANPVRILCAGCSSGEEPYSVMITLLEKYGPGVSSLVSVIGADIDSSVLSKAQQGRYGPLSFRGFPGRLRDKYFEPAGDNHYTIRNFLKDAVQFMNVNLKKDLFPETLQNLDTIFYRNVSIYFEPETRRNIFDRLAGLLKEKGWLFVSSTETLSHNHGSLTLVELDGVFCYQKNIPLALTDRRRPSSPSPEQPGAAVKIPVAKPAAIVPRPRPGPVQGLPAIQPVRPPATGTVLKAKPRTDRSIFDEALALAKNKNYEQALDRLGVLLKAEPSFVKGYLLKTGILINLKLLDEAERVGRHCIELDRWSLEGHLLLGLIARLQRDNQTAGQRFKEALYIQSSCWLAHFYLADIHNEVGERKNAVHEYETVVRLLAKGDLPAQGLTFFPLAFPAEQIVHLCHHNLKKLKQKTG
jgi:chemotaxis protein methyltransferase CheR